MERIDSDGKTSTWKNGERAYLMPLKCEVTIERQNLCYDGPDVFWGNCIVRFDDGILGECNSWQLRKIDEL